MWGTAYAVALVVVLVAVTHGPWAALVLGLIAVALSVFAWVTK